jgi:hypothetical protein
MSRSLIGIQNERIRNRINRKVEYELCKEYGLCYKCGIKCEINFKTNKLYHACKECRDIHELKRKYRRLKIS